MDKEAQKQWEQFLSETESRARATGASSVIHTNGGTFVRGDYFEAETVKGGKNYIIFMFVKDGMVYYCHGDKAKKAPESHFQKLIDYGDIVFVPPEKRDPERVALSVLGLMAMDNGLSFNDYMKQIHGYGEGSRA